jgi:hypothetical protein
VSYARKRLGTDGKPRYQATYRDAHGRLRAAGTFSNKKQAEAAGAKAEMLLAQGRLGGADTGKLSFRRYVDEIWYPNHVLEPSTRESYRYVIDKHLMPTFGPMKMNTILPSHVREWVTAQVARKVTPANIRHTRAVGHLHDRTQRSGHDAAPLQGREGTDRAGQGVPDPHARAVRAALRRVADR